MNDLGQTQIVRSGDLRWLPVAMNKNSQRIIAGLLVFAMIASIVIAIFAGSSDALPI